MVRRQTRQHLTWYRQYPGTVEAAVLWLQAVIKSKQILWKRGRILAQLQTTIDSHRHGRMFLLFGNNHNIVEHYRFFNELWHLGKDGIRLDGVTHIALEAFVTGAKSIPLRRRTRRMLRRLWRQRLRQRSGKARAVWRRKMVHLLTTDQQPLIDLYLRYGDRWALRMLEVINHFLLGNTYPPEMLNEIHATLRHARGYRGKVDIIASDMSARLRQRTHQLLCWIYPLREMFSLHAISQRLHRKRSVIAYMWGADHIRKDHFPRFLSPTDRVLSVRLAGGGAPDVWDMALARLTISPRLFAIPTPGARDGDWLIHLPPRSAVLAQALMSPSKQRARLSRTARKLLSPPNPLPLVRSYILRINRVLQRLRYRLSRCARPHRGLSVPVELEISGRGLVERVTFPQRRKLLLSQRRCLRQLLWKRAFESPPHRRPVALRFQLRFVP